MSDVLRSDLNPSWQSKRIPNATQLPCFHCRQLKPWAHYDTRTERALCADCLGQGIRLGGAQSKEG